jgi:L-threonylcarbamoyladenylate synthase
VEAYISDILAAGGPTIGFRAPDHPVAQAILQKSGLFLASTSANRSGKPSAKTGEEAFQALRGRVDLVLESGPAPLGRESTVVDFAASPPRMIRRGVISEQEILSVL